MKQYCPQCVAELLKDKKKLGDLSIWMVCPICGHRERPTNDAYEQQHLEYFLKRQEIRNKNINKFNEESISENSRW